MWDINEIVIVTMIFVCDIVFTSKWNFHDGQPLENMNLVVSSLDCEISMMF